MTRKEKQSQLERYRAILLATLDYLQERFGGSFVYDQFDPATEYYQEQKNQTEKYYTQRRLDRLQLRLENLTKGLQGRADLKFAHYIKERTGYDIDLFEDLRNRVDAVLMQDEIRNEKELNDIGTMLHFYHESSHEGKEVEKLRVMAANYSREQQETPGRKSEYSEVISRVNTDDLEVVTVRISTGPKPKHYEEQVATSPDGKRRLRVVQWDNGKGASTYVTVEFPTASGAVYGINGILPDIKAWWKNDSTIVIQTKKECTPYAQHHQVRSFDDIVSIEYIER